MYKSGILKNLSELGFIKAIAKPEKLDDILSKEKITVYCGFDLTAKSLHVGSLVQIMLLRKFYQHGHKIIFLLGGATTKIGDPTGKDETRKVLTETEIEENRQGIMQNFSKFVDINDPNVKILNNNDWFSEVKYVDFLRDIGTHFTVNRMLAMESVSLRLSKEQSMNFVEFNYMLFQAYDFAYLNKHHGCVLQVGGSDQWGNITEGMELCSRMNGSECFAITSPLITRSDGQKMGKSLKGAVSLCESLTSSFEYFQYFRNMPDEDIAQSLRYYTDLPIQEILELEKLKGQDINQAKKILAFEVTKLARGKLAAENALNEAENIFAMSQMPESEILTLKAKIEDPILKVLLQEGIIKSMADGKTLVKQEAIKLDGAIVNNFSFTFKKSGEFKLSLGKKKFYKIVVL